MNINPKELYCLLAEHTKLELDLINSFVIDSTLSNSLLHHLYCITSVPPLHNVYLTRQSKSTWLGYIWNTCRGSSMIPQMTRQLLCTGIKCSLGTTTHTRLPITTDLLHFLKTQLWNDASYSFLEKRLLWSGFTLAFMVFSGPVNLCHRACSGQVSSSQLRTTITIDLQQSRTKINPFRQG